MMNTHRKQKGLLSVELVVAISVLATIIGVLVTLEHSFGKLNNKLWAKHICRNAGQAQMDSIAATGTPIDNAAFEKLWPGVICTIEKSEGVGQWQGLQRIDLTLSKKVKRNNVRIQLTRYLLKGQGGAG
jgi:hypothetical protein